ncbi:hypothetical protein COLU111180_10465 [Cohnella lubricantis]|uniref:Uncharacterized protein n=1 Tax=Cohnella lubricantis TaxID=2163172 RepID=A0A841TJ09_9BACL|nr:hypothetical protein [Cohnella lubricantis]MBB6678481.1 hypothetical protein [Cohnella lubricantis]MBP2118404.1 hypothetical protein [Cohnella lubricantis]
MLEPPESPVTEEQLRELQGLPVCIVMNDGARHFGFLTGCSKGKVVLNGSEDDLAAESPQQVRPGRKRGRKRSGRGAGRRLAKTSGGKPKTGGEGTIEEPMLLAGADGWGYIGLGPPVPLFGPRVVLPIKPIDAVLLL